jgi:hypothetical protein
MLTLHDLIDRETLYGYRTFELWEGDVTNPGFPVDVLIVSHVSPGDYTPSPTSAVGALEFNHGVRLGRLANDPEYDLP